MAGRIILAPLDHDQRPGSGRGGLIVATTCRRRSRSLSDAAAAAAAGACGGARTISATLFESSGGCARRARAPADRCAMRDRWARARRPGAPAAGAAPRAPRRARHEYNGAVRTDKVRVSRGLGNRVIRWS